MKPELFVIDVDGTMTDGGIYYDNEGNEYKKFCVRDAAGFFAIHEAGAEILILTGRKCAAVERRMTELKVDYLYQNIREKARFLKEFCESNNILPEKTVYIGDDLNDLAAMKLSGYSACPADSCREVREQAHYVSGVKGGAGAVRDIVEYIYRQEGMWEKLVFCIYDTGI